MTQNQDDKRINPHLNNLVFSLYNFAKARRKTAQSEKGESIIPLEILKMLKMKIGANLTVDESKLINSLIEDIEGKPQDAEQEIERISIYDQQAEMLESQQNKTYKFSSIVDQAFSMVQIKHTIIQIMLGDLTVHPVEAIVSPDTTDLWMEQGVASVIRLKGGDSIRKEARKAGSVEIGDVFVTPAGDLTQRYIFHTAIMQPAEEIKRDQIQKALKNILRKAEDNKVKSIAIPALGIASTRFPYDAMAKTMIKIIFDYFITEEKTCINLAVISLFNREAYGFFVEQFRIAAAASSLKVEDFQ